jgi:putative transcriptional regulator
MAADIIVTLDLMLARRKMKAKDLAAAIGMTEANLSLLKSGKVRGVRFETMAKLCEVLDCKPGDLLDFGEAPQRAPTPAAARGVPED